MVFLNRDEAFIRPGRITLDLDLNSLNEKTTNDLIKYYYSEHTYTKNIGGLYGSQIEYIKNTSISYNNFLVNLKTELNTQLQIKNEDVFNNIINTRKEILNLNKY
jgi:flagellar biosynthesis/type III secretory pathway M-ring protein FliF/YscJ